MYSRKTLKLTVLLILFFTAQLFSQKGNYELIAEFQPPHSDFSRNSHDRKYQLNAIKLSESGRLLIADYGNKNSLVAIYSLDSLKCIGAYWVPSIIELEECYFNEDDTKLYVRASRYSSDYKVVFIDAKVMRDISCEKTPRGCVTATSRRLSMVKFYSTDRKYYFAVNSNDKRTLHIYKLVEED